MLSRRQLRIKVLQALYAFFQSEKTDLSIAERELFRNIEKVHELYIYLLLFIREVANCEESDVGDLHLKFFPSEEEVKAKRRLFELKFIKELISEKTFQKELARIKVSWQKENDLVRKIFFEIKKSKEYRDFLKIEESDEKEFLSALFKKFIENSSALRNHIEEENIFWQEDFDFICQMISRMIRSYYENGRFELLPLYKDEKDDKEFVKILFTKTILNNKEYEEAISERTKNWEVERIALMDILILKMALAELMNFPSIPIKVTINEYIDISKEYSTPKSKQFVNGIIDKISNDFKEQGKIVKTGRGLIG